MILIGVVLCAMTIALIMPFFAEAQAKGGFVPLADFSGSGKLSTLYAENNKLEDYLSKIFMGAIALGAILAVLRLSWAGFVYMSSDLWSSKGHAKEIIQETMLGLFLLLAIWLILNLINPDLLKLKVEPQKLAPTATAEQKNFDATRFGD